MSIFPIFDLRRVIPRWRNSRVTITIGELYSLKKNEKTFDDTIFNEKIQVWKNHKTIENASEILAESIIRGVNNEAINAAELILSDSPEKNKTLITIAKDILTQSGGKSSKDANKKLTDRIDINNLHGQIHLIKRKLIEYPRNSLMWVDLSRLYATLGQLKQSNEAMIKGLIISPNNRFILRSATRLFIHLEKPDLAHSLLEKKDITGSDPWLMAAEIASASVAYKSSRFIKKGMALIKNAKYSPYQIAELARALGTIELTSGSSKKAKKLFKLSLENPTENSVAQSVWAKKEIPSLEVNNAIHETPRTYEAKALNALTSQNWFVAVEEAISWMTDETFSSRPEQISRKGLIANPNDPILINNLAFALANQEKLVDARAVLEKITWPLTEITNEVAVTATDGLINYRQGNVLKGKALYEKALLIATHSKNERQLALASLYFAREMFLAGEIESNDAIMFAEKACFRVYDPVVTWLLSRIKEIASGQNIKN